MDEAICWLDIETTGLNPVEDKILELAYVVTDMSLSGELGSCDYLFPTSGRFADQFVMDEFVTNMHTESGLLEALEEVPYVPLTIAQLTVEDDLAKIMAEHGIQKLYLGGMSVHFDRSFLKEWMPAVEKLFHHRHADVSSFKILWDVAGLEKLQVPNPNPHRAIYDCYEAIDIAIHVRNKLKGLA